MLALVTAGLAVAVAAAYAVDLRWHPYARCWACKGKGTNRGSTARRYGVCGRCQGTRRRVRVLARVVRPELRKGRKS